MQIGLAQLNFHIANFEDNASKIIHALSEAREENIDLMVFPEFSISGYPPLDLLEREDFILKCEHYIRKVAGYCDGIAAIVGGPERNPNREGKNLYNAAYFLSEGKVSKIIRKSLLPTYDIFDEYRYFEPNTSFGLLEFMGKRIALTICEDLWDQQEFETDFGKGQLYTIAPMEELSKLQPDLIINIAASPYSYHREVEKRGIFTSKARTYRLPLFMVNQVGAQTELIFEGGSLVVDASGQIVDQMVFFQEMVQYYDLDDLERDSPAPEGKGPIIHHIYEALVLGIRDYFGKSGFKSAVLGLSGGIDSAVSLAIASHALGPENLYALLLPSQYSSDHSISDSVKLAENLGVSYETISIRGIVTAFTASLEPYFKDLPEDIAEENIQARVRAVILMAFSNKFGHILLNTSNKSETAVGYGTLYGDMAGGLSVLGDVYKTEVYNLARHINKEGEIIPENIIQKPPSAELKPGQKDTDSLPEYGILDQILYRYIELQRSPEKIIQEGYRRDLVQRIIDLINANEYKRYQTPPILRISSKAFGLGRRMPLVARYDFMSGDGKA